MSWRLFVGGSHAASRPAKLSFPGIWTGRGPRSPEPWREGLSKYPFVRVLSAHGDDVRVFCG